METLRTHGSQGGAVEGASPAAAPTVSRETLWLRLGGMTIVMASLGAIAVFEESLDPTRLVGSADSRSAAWMAVALLVSINGPALGLVLLLAGLQEHSLLTSRRARRAALVRMAAVNVMAVCAVIGVVLTSADAVKKLSHLEWYGLAMLLAFVVVARASFLLFRSGWKYEAQTAEEALASDPRPPVVYLRSFGIDDQILTTSRGLGSRLAGFFNYGAIVSPEQEMAFIMDRVGPVIAIGKPGERLPELGAARLYVGDDQWREVVGHLLNRAALVVIRAGDTPNLWWEIAEARNRCPLERIVIVALGPPSALTTFERRFAETFGVPTALSGVRQSRVVEMLLRWVFAYARASGKILYFDRQGRPFEQPLSRRVAPSTVILAPLTAYRPHRDSLQSAFKIVFPRLGLHWTPKRTLTIAVMLALFGGIFGLHHFYMGNRRRAIWYVAFFWLAVPILLGWIDAVRLALLNDAQFQAQLGGREDAVSGER